MTKLQAYIVFLEGRVMCAELKAEGIEGALIHMGAASKPRCQFLAAGFLPSHWKRELDTSTGTKASALQ